MENRIESYIAGGDIVVEKQLVFGGPDGYWKVRNLGPDEVLLLGGLDSLTLPASSSVFYAKSPGNPLTVRLASGKSGAAIIVERVD